MKTTSYIARRYLFSKKHISLISTLTLISITGITIGTALLIVVLSVFNGFFDVVKGLLLSYDPDIRIEPANRNEMVFDRQLIEQLESIPEVEVATPYVSGKAMLSQERRQDRVVNIRGVRSEDFLHMNRAENIITSGSFDLEVTSGSPGLLIDERQMNELNLHVGEQVVLLSADGLRKSLTQFSYPNIYRFTIRGAYSMEQVINEPAVYVDMEAAQRLFDARNMISGIDLRLSDSERAASVKNGLETMLGNEYAVSSWYDLQRPLYDVMYMEKWGSYVILMIIVLVAVSNIVGSLTMIVIQKNRDIGILSTMGLAAGKVKKIFVIQGLYIGFIGCGIGGTVGLLLSWMQKEYGLVKLSSAFIIEAYPVSIHAADVVVILAGTLLLCLGASWYPARRASEVEPASAIRYE